MKVKLKIWQVEKWRVHNRPILGFIYLCHPYTDGYSIGKTLWCHFFPYVVVDTER